MSIFYDTDDNLYTDLKYKQVWVDVLFLWEYYVAVLTSQLSELLNQNRTKLLSKFFQINESYSSFGIWNICIS